MTLNPIDTVEHIESEHNDLLMCTMLLCGYQEIKLTMYLILFGFIK